MTTRRRTPRRRAVLLAAVAVLLVPACSVDRALPPAAVPATPTAQVGAAVGAAAAASRAAELEAGLTAVLVERVHVLAAAATAGGAEARAALDASSVALATVLGAAYRGAREPLLEALRACDEARLAGRGRRAEAACGPELTAVVRRVVPRLDPAQVDGLGAAPVTGGPPALREAGQRARATAGVLAGAVAEDRGLGSTTTPAATLRSDLTWLLVEHVALAVAAAGSSPAAARSALGANGDALAALLGRSYPEVRAPFALVWGRHLDRLQSWTSALVAGQQTQAGLLRAGVLALPAELGPVLAGHVEVLSPSRLAQELRPATASLVAAVEARARRAPGAVSLLQKASADVPATAALLAAAVAEDLRLA